jgi:serine protease Do
MCGSMRAMSACVVVLSLLTGPVVGSLAAQSREEKVRKDREKVEAEGFWIYNDLPTGFARAKESGKPLLVVLRCIPCEECVKLDDDLVDQDPVIRPLLDKFVCVRQVSTNGLDLSLFQYDTDQSFAVFLLNADGTIYGRFGTRSHRTDWLFDVSLPGMARALEGALELHAEYPANKQALAGKRGQPLEFASPEKYPSLKDKYTDKLATSGNVVKSCIHCHQIGDAQRAFYRAQGKPIPERVLFPYPHPKSIGLILDPEQRATVKEVLADSPASRSGFQTGDVIETLDGQPLLSFADVQWVLHQTDSAAVKAVVKRGDTTKDVTLKLPEGWRTRGDIAWRATSWGLRRMGTGGLKLEPASDEERRDAKIAAGSMALIVEHVGQYGEHAAGKNAGFQQNDLIVRFDDRTDLVTETDVFRHTMTRRKPGESVPVVVKRGGKEVRLKLPMQK